MPTTIRTCRKSKISPQGCEHYSYKKLACTLGKINPSKANLKGVIEVERICGFGYICQFSKWREKLNDYWRKELQ